MTTKQTRMTNLAWRKATHAAQQRALAVADVRPAHTRGLAHFSDDWYAAQQAAFEAHMAVLGYPKQDPKPSEPIDALVVTVASRQKWA